MANQACGNCETPLNAEFCQRCGQRRAREISIRRILREGLLRVVDLDAGFLHTFRELSVSPGAFIRHYLEGKRQPCTNPLKYCFIVITIYALAINILNVDFGNTLDLDAQEREVFHIIHGVLAYLMFLVLFPVAAVQRWLFRETRWTFSETYVFGLFVVGHGSWIGVMMAVGGLLQSTSGIIVLAVAQLAYLLWVMRGFYSPKGRPPVIRAVLVFATTSICSNLLALAAGNMIAWFGLVEPLSGSIA